jgi:hypothetical protein
VPDVAAHSDTVDFAMGWFAPRTSPSKLPAANDAAVPAGAAGSVGSVAAVDGWLDTTTALVRCGCVHAATANRVSNIAGDSFPMPEPPLYQNVIGR